MSTYKIFLIPLDSNSPGVAPTSFDVHVVCNLEFSPGTFDTAAIAAAVAAHPFLGRGPAAKLSALAMPYGGWQTGGRVLNPTTPGSVPVELTYVGPKPLARLQEALAAYLFRPAPVAVVPLAAHDRRFDDLSEANFVEISKVHDDLAALRSELQRSALKSFGISKCTSITSLALDSFSYEQARWINGHVQATLLDAIFAPVATRTSAIRPELSGSLDRVRDAVQKIQRRIEPQGTVLRALRAGETQIVPSDPNVSMHAALKNGVISESCGVTTTWRAAASQPLIGDYVLQLDVSGLTVDAAVAAVTAQPTAFRRKDHTHPLSFTDIGKAESSNTSLACLNDDAGNPRYRAISINAEASVYQNTVLQSKNSISNSAPAPAPSGNEFKDTRDDRPPQLLEAEQFGINEPECAGIMISAPTADLVTPPALADPQRNNTLPCLFLEDLWVGYRLDMAEETAGPLLSTHKQTQEITFKATGKKVHGATEDFVAREQPGDPDAGATSTELCRYQGLNSAQLIDYMRFVGNYRDPIVPADAPFRSVVVGYEDATPVHFDHVYKYRFRLVFLGAISLSDRDPNLDRYGSRYVQSCPFYRARAYRPGQIVSDEGKTRQPSGKAGHTVFLNSEHPNASVWIVPVPLDTESARYHGTFLAKADEPQRNAHRSFVTDVAKYFKDRPKKLQYFLDPEVSEIAVRVTMMNGNPDELDHQFLYQGGAFCELVRHLRLPAVRARFGKPGQWERFRPIEIFFSTTTDLKPQIVSKTGLGDAINIRIRVPPGADLEISMLPVLSERKLFNTAAHAASSAQLSSRRLRARSLAAEPFAALPAVVENQLRVVHSLKRPTLAPAFGGLPLQASSQKTAFVAAERARFGETAELTGYVRIDAASSGQLRLEASWSDVDDNPALQRFTTNAATTVSAPHSISFERYKPPAAAVLARAPAAIVASSLKLGTLDFADTFDLQSAENKVFFGTTAPRPFEAQGNRPCVLNFGDTRRRRAAITAVAVGRYSEQFPKLAAVAFEMRSESITVEVPASMRLSSPDISHVVPLSSEISHEAGGARRAQRIYAMRVYVRRPWFLSGPGERLAIGCHAGLATDAPTQSLNKYVTQWGEDPIERPKLEVTRRSPRASDFRVPNGPGDVVLDEALYPASSPEGAAAVIYRDSLIRSSNGTDSDHDTISAASFALRWDGEVSLWYCDVEVANAFSGWCGMAVYRHQLHAHEETQISEIPAWIYGAVLHGETLSWINKGGKLHITVGPVLDLNTEFFLDTIEYKHGISTDVRIHSGGEVALKKYAVGDQVYFEGIVIAGISKWSLVKKRFGDRVASVDLGGG